MTRSNIWLSVDWDFFVPEKEDWAFAHAEEEDFRGLLWEMRYQQFKQNGDDLKAEMALSPVVKNFWRRLQLLGYTFRSTKAIVVGDSHQWAYHAFRRSLYEGAPLVETKLVHFDAHHDLTYNIVKFEEEAFTEHVTCENWLLMTLLSQIGLRSLICYPEWKGLRDWEKSFGKYHRSYPELIQAIDRFAEPCVWPSRRIEESAGDVELVYICRSSPWTPPWHDGAFKDLVESLQTLTGVKAETPFVDAEGIDPLMARSFKPGRAYAETEKSYLERHPLHA